MDPDKQPAQNGQPIMERAGKRYELDVNFHAFTHDATVVVRKYDATGEYTIQIFGDAIGEIERRDHPRKKA